MTQEQKKGTSLLGNAKEVVDQKIALVREFIESRGLSEEQVNRMKHVFAKTLGVTIAVIGMAIAGVVFMACGDGGDTGGTGGSGGSHHQKSNAQLEQEFMSFAQSCGWGQCGMGDHAGGWGRNRSHIIRYIGNNIPGGKNIMGGGSITSLEGGAVTDISAWVSITDSQSGNKILQAINPTVSNGFQHEDLEINYDVNN